MPYSRVHVPKLQHHRSTGRAYARFDGRCVYFGRWGSPEAEAEYNATIRRWLDNGRRLPESDPEPVTVAELIAAFWTHAEGHYVKGGRPTTELGNFRAVLRIVKRLYAGLPADEFGPRALRACRDEMVRAGWVRRSINKQVSRVRSVFRWGVSQELVAVETLTALETLGPLLAGRAALSDGGRAAAPESEPVTAVPGRDLAAALAEMPPAVRGLAEFQLATAARPGEAVRLRLADIDREGPVVAGVRLWVYRPGRHKGEHHGKGRTLYLGPRAQSVVAAAVGVGPASGGGGESPVFRTPRGKAYTVDGYAGAVARACEAAAMAHVRGSRPDVWMVLEVLRGAWRLAESAYGSSAFKVRKPTAAERRELRSAATEARKTFLRWLREVGEVLGAPRHWHPHRLRHNALERLEAEHGLEAAQYVAGHEMPDTTRIYSAAHLAKAAETMAKSG
jgi:integrase